MEFFFFLDFSLHAMDIAAIFINLLENLKNDSIKSFVQSLNKYGLKDRNVVDILIHQR